MIDIKKLKKMNFGKVDEKPKLKEYTTYKVGGPCEAVVSPSSTDNLISLITYLRENDIPYKVLGNGSNVIFDDEGYRGVIIKLDAFDDLYISGHVIRVGAGYNVMKLSLKLSRMGYTGTEFASGIPGTIGGAVFMNAGAYQSDMGYITREVKVLTPDMEIKTFSNREMKFHYRSSFLKENPGYICLEATIVVGMGSKTDIMELIEERKIRRMASQPLEYPSAGSVFRNPEGMYAGQLIEELGYKGKKIGGALVSTKHANFIVNDGGATCHDIETLIRSIQKDVKDKYGIVLREEQEFVK